MRPSTFPLLRRRRLIPAALLATASLALPGCGAESAAQPADDHHRVELEVVRMRPGFTVTREYAGEVQAGQASRLGFERGGQVDRIDVDEGDTVSAGQVLATLDTRLLDAEGEELAARRQELVTELELARRNEQRIARLRDEQLASEREHDESSSRTAVLEASLKRVEADLSSNGVRRAQSTLRAPFGARIVSREVDTGAVVAAGSPVFSVVDNQNLEIRAGLPAAYATTLSVGDPLEARVHGQLRRATILALGPRVDAATRTRPVRFGLDADAAPGEIAYILVDEPHQAEGAWLPDTAVTEGARGTWVVYAAVTDDADPGLLRLETRSVTVRHAVDDQVYVTGALADGLTVVSAGLHRLAPGQRVVTDRREGLANARQDP